MDAGSLTLICYTIQFAQLANRGFSVSNPQRSGSQVKPYQLMCPTSTLQTSVAFQMLLKAYSNHSWCYRDRGSSIIWLMLFILSVMMHEIKGLERLGRFLTWETEFSAENWINAVSIQGETVNTGSDKVIIRVIC